MSWKTIADALQAASLDAVRKLLSAHAGERIYAVALYTADEGISVTMAANTEEAYKAHLASEAKDEANTPEDEVYYRWASSEWALEGWERETFTEVNALIQQEDRRDFEAYFKALTEAMMMALAGVRAKLGEQLADVTMFVTVTDSDLAEDIENASAARINGPDLARPFQSRFG